MGSTRLPSAPPSGARSADRGRGCDDPHHRHEIEAAQGSCRRRSRPAPSRGGPLLPKRGPRSGNDGERSSHFRSELAPRVGFEPTTNRLTADCSTAELPRISVREARLYAPAGRGATGLGPACPSPRACARAWRRAHRSAMGPSIGRSARRAPVSPHRVSPHRGRSAGSSSTAVGRLAGASALDSRAGSANPGLRMSMALAHATSGRESPRRPQG